MTTYTVALQDGRDLPTRERIDAEVRFACELERVLGGEAYVVQTYGSRSANPRPARSTGTRQSAQLAGRSP
jgi:hypothetical protein